MLDHSRDLYLPLLSLAIMIIAVDARSMKELGANGCFIHELFKTLVKNHPEHQFYFLFDGPFDETYSFSSNVHPIIVLPKASRPVLLKYWYDIKIPSALKKTKADIFVSPNSYGSLTSKCPQCLVVQQSGFAHHSDSYKISHLRFLKKNTPKFLKRAKRIVAVSEFVKRSIEELYKIDASRIDVVYNGARDNFHPLSFDESLFIKERYTEGKEYFLCPATIQTADNLVNLLKAFSIFKKRLQSSMKLIIAGSPSSKNAELLQLIHTYKYRDDVVLTGDVPTQDLPLLAGAAYALVYPTFLECFCVSSQEAMKCEVPVLASQNTSIREIAGEAGLYFNASDHEDIAGKLMLIYKDENLRKDLIEKGKLAGPKYDWQRSAEVFWESILKTVDA